MQSGTFKWANDPASRQRTLLSHGLQPVYDVSGLPHFASHLDMLRGAALGVRWLYPLRPPEPLPRPAQPVTTFQDGVPVPPAGVPSSATETALKAPKRPHRTRPAIHPDIEPATTRGAPEPQLCPAGLHPIEDAWQASNGRRHCKACRNQRDRLRRARAAEAKRGFSFT